MPISLRSTIRWVQLKLGEALIKKYVQQAKALEGTPRKVLKTGSAPHFMPKKPGPRPKVTGLAGLPTQHVPVNYMTTVRRRPIPRLCLPSRTTLSLRCADLVGGFRSRDPWRDRNLPA